MTLAVSRMSEPDRARARWSAATIRVCWELLSNGVSARPHVVAAARAHVLATMPADIGADQVDWAAAALTRDFLRRVRDGVYESVELESWPSSLRGVDASRIQDAGGPLGEVLYRVHYGDGLSLTSVSAQAAVPEVTLRAARGSMREVARLVVAEVLEDALRWSDARVDDAVRYLAHRPSRGCPGPVGLLSEAGQAHADECARCSRAVRLIKGGVLASSDLFPPEQLGLHQETEVVAILLHPDARPHRGTVGRALAEISVEIDGEGWLVDARDLPKAHEMLAPLARTGSPGVDHLRVGMARGPGQWHPKALLGHLPLNALADARGRPWGEISPLPALPQALPPPPSVAWFWLAAVVLLGLTLGLGRAMWWLPPVAELDGLEASFVPVESGWQVRFDADDLHDVALVAERGGVVHLVSSGGPVHRAAWSSGEGDYRLRVHGDSVALVAGDPGEVDVPALVLGLEQAGRGLDALEATLAGTSSAVQLSRSPVPEHHSSTLGS